MIISRKHITYIILGLCAAVISGALGGFLLALTHDLPQIRALESFKPAAVTRIYSSDNELLAELFVQKREPVSLDVIPDYLKQAILATEDRQFFEHPGVDLRGIVRAVIKDIGAAKYVEGASTITQQLAKTLFLTSRKTIMRKIKEAFLAVQIERRHTKEEILQLYLNQIYFGSGAYGVGAAARIFFGKPVTDLTLAECALIAGMPKSPSRYSPLVNQSLALKRRDLVLGQMADEGFISPEQLTEAKASPLNPAKKMKASVKAPYFVGYVMKFLEKQFGETRMYRMGMTVYTTLDYQMQIKAEKAVLHGLKQLAARMARRGLLKGDDPQAALVCTDTSGVILAMVGGSNPQESQFNRATMARRQPGSAFKPLVYALAVQDGFAQNYVLWDAPVIFKGAKEGQAWTPKNFSGKFKGEMTLRRALAVSQNIPAVKLLGKLGPTPAVQFAYHMGVESPLSPNLSLVLGTSEVTLLELTAAYAVFPSKGVWTRPFGIVEVQDRDGQSLWRTRPHRRTAISAETAAVMTDMLRAVVQEGTGRAAKRIGRPLAGKTGTTDNYRDALFVGFSPTIATGVWVGMDDHDSLGDKETGARAALPIWIDFMQEVLTGRTYRNFDLPDDVVKVSIDAETGLLASENCPTAVTAVFAKGTEPKQYSKTCDENGLGRL